MNVAIIGGGAAGFFSAINVRENFPKSKVTIFEKSNKLLAKIKISGGGRCNVTNGCQSIDELAAGYPRGNKLIKKNFYTFNNTNTFEWFASRGVPLYIQADNRAFPKTNDSQTIIDCLMKEVTRLNIKIEMNRKLKSLKQLNDNRIELLFDNEPKNVTFDKVIVATGGSPKKDGLMWLAKLNHAIEEPVPSLFTFKIPQNAITKLMGLAVESTTVSIQGTKLKSKGPLLITHWGMSGPAVLKLSAFGARLLSEMNYNFTINVNWVEESNTEVVSDYIRGLIADNPNKQLANVRPYSLPSRLWLFLIDKLEIAQSKTWAELGKKGVNRLTNILTNDEYSVKGRTTFREEFVTCGGVSLKSVDMNTMQSKVVKNLYFAGEVLDIDGITGGYNFQNAWTSGFVAAKLHP